MIPRVLSTKNFFLPASVWCAVFDVFGPNIAKMEVGDCCTTVCRPICRRRLRSYQTNHYYYYQLITTRIASQNIYLDVFLGRSQDNKCIILVKNGSLCMVLILFISVFCLKSSLTKQNCIAQDFSVHKDRRTWLHELGQRSWSRIWAVLLQTEHRSLVTFLNFFSVYYSIGNKTRVSGFKRIKIIFLVRIS